MKRHLIIIFFVMIVIFAAGVWVYFIIRGTPLNVVLVSIDTLRPDHLGCYGYERDTSPAIDLLAREGARFENAVSSTSWTLPAHVALLTSLPDPVHGVLWDNHRLDENRVTMAELLKAHGYATCGIFTGPYLLPRFGFEQGFDQYIDCTIYDKNIDANQVLVASERGRTTPGAIAAAEKWIRENRGKPFFLFLHLFDAHPDFDPPSPYNKMFDPGYDGDMHGRDVFHNPAIHRNMAARDLDHLRALYDGEIRFVDDKGILRLIEILELNRIKDRTLIVITSDHGEEFFEHGEFGHRKNLYDTTLKIPLIFWRPGLVPAGKVLKDQVRIIDIMPTVFELLGIEPGMEAMGRSLAGYFSEGKTSELDESLNFSEITSNTLHMEAIRTEGFKLILDYSKNVNLYFDYSLDPEENKAIVDPGAPGFSKAMGLLAAEKRALNKCRDSIPWSERADSPMDPETRERLRSIGYIE